MVEKGWGLDWQLEHLPSMRKALYSTPSTSGAGRIRYDKRKTDGRGRESGKRERQGGRERREAGKRTQTSFAPERLLPFVG